jgi:hypothetical protein
VNKESNLHIANGTFSSPRNLPIKSLSMKKQITIIIINNNNKKRPNNFLFGLFFCNYFLNPKTKSQYTATKTKKQKTELLVRRAFFFF